MRAMKLGAMKTSACSGAVLSGFALAGLVATAAGAAEPEKVWEASGFKQPESALYDSSNDVIYVSNVNGEPAASDGNGFISKLGPDGEIVTLEWVTGLDAPKGLALVGDRLYVADIDELIAIDIGTGEIVERHEAAGSKFLNDATADEEGRVYATDMLENTIWVLEDGELSVLLKDPALANPNGLLAENGRLLVASWGNMAADFSTEVPGHAMVIDLDGKTVSALGDTTPVGNLDGIEPDGKGGYYATDWLSGGLFHITGEGKATKLLPLEQGSADLGIGPDNLLLVPMMMHGTVTAYRVE
jgi:DNA-binding beta-propeller fold protein YncE